MFCFWLPLGRTTRSLIVDANLNIASGNWQSLAAALSSKSSYLKIIHSCMAGQAWPWYVLIQLNAANFHQQWEADIIDAQQYQPMHRVIATMTVWQLHSQTGVPLRALIHPTVSSDDEESEIVRHALSQDPHRQYGSFLQSSFLLSIHFFQSFLLLWQ